MRRSEKEITDRKSIDAVLERAPVLRLAMVDGDRPYVVPLCFGYRDNALYFHCATEGMKLDILAANPRVCFECDIDTEVVPGKAGCNWSMKYRSIIGFGTASRIEHLEAKREACDILMAHYTDRVFDYPDDALGKTAFFRIDIKSITGKQSGHDEG